MARVAGWSAGAVCAVVVVATVAFFIVYARTDIPDPNQAFRANATIVTYADGTSPIGSFYEQNRSSVPLSQIPKAVQDAVIAAEDRTFWTNAGVSVPGIARAAANIVRGGQLQGGSTITQQYVKIMYLTQERTLTRKLDELFIATKLSRTRSKETILEGYLNTIYFGEGAYGVRAAGQAYFGVDHPSGLSISQAAFLAAVLNNPTRFDPDEPKARQRILERYRYVLNGMRGTGAITEHQHAACRKALPALKKKTRGGRYAGPKGFLLEMARRELATYGFDGDQLTGGGLRVVTTFDRTMQARAVEAVRTARPAGASGLNIALASVRPGTGEVVALVGGQDFLKSQRNWATTKAPPGSVVRPFALAAAARDGLPGTYELAKSRQADNSVSRLYFDLIDSHRGELVTTAAEAAGIPRIPAGDRSGPGLGPDPLASPLDVAGAYATFAAGGSRAPARVIREVRNAHGKVLWTAAKRPELRPVQAFTPDVAMVVNDVLQRVMAQTRDSPVAVLPPPAGGKGGTATGLEVRKRRVNARCKCRKFKGTPDTLASWWTAATPELSTAVLYRAGPDGQSDLDPYSEEKGFPGTRWPAETWLSYIGGTEPYSIVRSSGRFPKPDRWSPSPAGSS